MENWKTASTLSQNGERKPHGTSPRAIVGLSLWTYVYKHFCIHTCFSNIAFTYLLSLFEYTVLLQNKNIVVHIVLWPAFFWGIYWMSWTIFYFVNVLIYSKSSPFVAIFLPSDFHHLYNTFVSITEHSLCIGHMEGKSLRALTGL